MEDFPLKGKFWTGPGAPLQKHPLLSRRASGGRSGWQPSNQRRSDWDSHNACSTPLPWGTVGNSKGSSQPADTVNPGQASAEQDTKCWCPSRFLDQKKGKVSGKLTHNNPAADAYSAGIYSLSGRLQRVILRSRRERKQLQAVRLGRGVES